MKIRTALLLLVALPAWIASARPAPRPALAARLAEGPEVIGIVHWGLNTYTDREWGFGDEDPAMLNPKKFEADGGRAGVRNSQSTFVIKITKVD